MTAAFCKRHHARVLLEASRGSSMLLPFAVCTDKACVPACSLKKVYDRSEGAEGLWETLADQSASLRDPDVLRVYLEQVPQTLHKEPPACPANRSDFPFQVGFNPSKPPIRSEQFRGVMNITAQFTGYLPSNTIDIKIPRCQSLASSFSKTLLDISRHVTWTPFEAG